MERCDICYIISLGFSARMILHTNLICELKNAGLNNISVILPGKDDGAFKKYEETLGIKVYYADVKNTFWSNEYLNFRKYLYEDVRNNPALMAKHIKSIEDYHGYNPWRKFKPYIYAGVNFVMTKLKFLRGMFEYFEKFILRNKKLRKLIKEINPRIVVSTYPVNYVEGSGIQVSKRAGITTVTQLLSWDNITCKGRFPAISDYFISWGKIMSDELSEYYKIDGDKIFTTGVPHFDKSKELANPDKRKKYISSLGLDPNKPYLLFGMSSPYFAPREIDIVERVADHIGRGIYGEGMQLIVRPHPQNVQGEMSDESWLPRLEKIKSSRVGIDYPITEKSNLPWNMSEEDLEKLANLISGCSILLNSGSTISIEGLIHEKPVILTLFDGDANVREHNSARRLRNFDHLRKITNTRALKVVYHYEELKKAILKYLEHPETNKKERETALMQECGKVDGGSTHRVAMAFKQILETVGR